MVFLSDLRIAGGRNSADSLNPENLVRFHEIILLLFLKIFKTHRLNFFFSNLKIQGK